MADTILNPDNLRRCVESEITNTLNAALAELPGRWPIGRKRWLLFSGRRRVAISLTDAIWPHVLDAAAGIAQSIIDDAQSVTGSGS